MYGNQLKMRVHRDGLHVFIPFKKFYSKRALLICKVQAYDKELIPEMNFLPDEVCNVIGVFVLNEIYILIRLHFKWLRSPYKAYLAMLCLICDIA